MTSKLAEAVLASPVVVFKPRFDLVQFKDMQVRRSGCGFVAGLLKEGEMSLGRGQPGCRKTFLYTSLAVHVAAGMEWFGHKVKRGPVIYLAAEAGASIFSRFVALRQHHRLEGQNIPLAVMPSPIDLCDPKGDTKALIELLDSAASDFEQPIMLVIVDTTSRVMAGGDENNSTDMGSLVRNVDLIRAATGAHVAMVHHEGKDRSRGARGHSLLLAAVDTEIEIVADKGGLFSTAKVTKQRDLPTEGEIRFGLEIVEIGADDEGEAISSCVAVTSDKNSTKVRPVVRGAAGIILDVLAKAIKEHGDNPPKSPHYPDTTLAVSVELWRSLCYQGELATSDNPDTKRKAFVRACNTLKERKIIGIWRDWVWLT